MAPIYRPPNAGSFLGDGGGGSSVADIIMSGGQRQAQLLLEGGRQRAAAFEGIGSDLAGGLAAFGQARADKKVTDATRAAAAPGADVNAILSGLPPELQGRAMKGISDWNEFSSKRQESDLKIKKAQSDLVDAQKARDQHDKNQLAMGAFRTKGMFDTAAGAVAAINMFHGGAKQEGLADDRWDTFVSGVNDGWQAAKGDPKSEAMFLDAVKQQAGPLLDGIMQSGDAPTQDKFKPDVEKVEITNADGSKTIKLVEKKPGQSFESAAPPVNLQTKDTTKGIQTFNPREGTLGPVIGQPKPPASTIINPQAVNDVRDAVTAMKSGTVPPQLPGRSSKEYIAVMAEAKRQGYDLASAATDWTATQKHIATMNGAQQLRLNQSINALPELLDSVDQLASKWKGGRFPILNKANLIAAKNGAYGSDVASVANQLEAQVADVVADLGTVYMGGNSPTDHGLSLAGKSLSGDWDEKVLHDAVSRAKQNVIIRQNSIKNTGVAGASDGNPYAPKPAEAAPAPATPKPGDKKTFPNGRVGVWDGRGYVAQ